MYLSLDKQGLADDTLVLFTSDNGGVNKPTLAGEATQALQAGLAVSGPFRGGKHDVWEGGFRVPYIVRWPSRRPSGTIAMRRPGQSGRYPGNGSCVVGPKVTASNASSRR